MQDDLFGAPPPSTAASSAAPAPHSRRSATPSEVRPAVVEPALHTCAAQLPPQVRLGVSTWSYPGWAGLVWDGMYDASTLSKKGLAAYSQHPLMRTVSVDRSFWRPLTDIQYAQMAAQVPSDFRFMVKCPNVVTDALVRDEQGKGQVVNPMFLQPALALSQFVEPAVAGLGAKLGVLVYQLSPLPWQQLQQLAPLYQALDQLLAATHAALHRLQATATLVAVEVRDPELLQPALIEVLQRQHATLCLGLHGKMPPIEAQLPWLRALWPTPLVCRWNLNRSFGPFGYPAAQEKHAPFDTLRSPDPHTRAILARTMAGIAGAGQPVFVTVSNDAEGCAPRSIALLAQAVLG